MSKEITDHGLLLPCPFCGAEGGRVFSSHHSPPSYHVECAYCGGRTGQQWTSVRAENKWNRRPG